MSLYNTVLGENEFSGLLLSMLGFQSRSEIPRYRDCWWNGKEIVVYTHVGGGNRNDYKEEIGALQNRKGYTSDEDDEYDFTFAAFYYTFPPEFETYKAAIKPETRTVRERWEEALKKISNKDPSTLKQIEPIVAALKEALDGETPQKDDGSPTVVWV